MLQQQASLVVALEPNTKEMITSAVVQFPASKSSSMLVTTIGPHTVPMPIVAAATATAQTNIADARTKLKFFV
jgi:hypothetical protein